MSVTNNANNLYTVEIVIDSNNPSSPPLYTASGVLYYKVAITPKNLNVTSPHSGYDMVPYVGNFKIDGETGRFNWLWNFNQTSTCLPPPTPHGINSSFDRLHSYQGATGSCVGSFSNSRLSVQGPIRFNNDAYVQGDFLTDSVYATWSHIHLVELYEDAQLNYVNANMENPSTGLLATNSNNWQVWDGVTPAPSLIRRLGKPVRIDAYVYVVYDPNISPVNQVINIDFDCADAIAGCMDPSAINGTYNPNATVSNPSACQYPPPVYSITFDCPSGNATGPYSNIFTNSQFAILNPNGTRNFRFNGGVPKILNNTYEAGEYVDEIVTIDLTPVVPNFSFNDYEAVYDFPITSPNGGPDWNLDVNDPDIGFGDSMNNLTAASIRFLNLDNYNSLSQTPNYLSIGASGFVSGTSSQPSWVADGWGDSTGAMPSTIVYFGDGIDTFDDNGDPINLDTDGIQLQEFYYANSDPQLILNPGYEWYPYKLTLSILLDFVMPAHNLYVVLDLDHNTENQGGNI